MTSASGDKARRDLPGPEVETGTWGGQTGWLERGGGKT